MGARATGIRQRSLAQLDHCLQVNECRHAAGPAGFLLLFLQWPLRDLVQAYSREANDLAQVLFALYVSIALTQATRQRTHLATDALARHLPQVWRQRIAGLRRWQY